MLDHSTEYKVNSYLILNSFALVKFKCAIT